MTDELIAHVKQFEGWRAAAYRDSGGLPTIGFGHRVDSMDTGPLTPEEGEALLRSDLQHYEAMALRMSPVLSEDPRRLAAITDFCFNCGGGNYSGSRLRVAVRERDWQRAARENMKWVYITVDGEKVTSAWQVKRRAVTSRWLREGSASTQAVA